MMKRLRSGWLWVMTAVRLLGDISGVRVLLAGHRFAKRVALLIFIVSLPVVGFPQNASRGVSPIGILLIGAIIFLVVHHIAEVRGESPDAPELPDIGREFRESLDDFQRTHHDLADVGRSESADDGEKR